MMFISILSIILGVNKIGACGSGPVQSAAGQNGNSATESTNQTLAMLKSNLCVASTFGIKWRRYG